MITKWYRRLLGCLPAMLSSSTTFAQVPIVDASGSTRYIGGRHAADGLLAPSNALQLGSSNTSYGIRVGSGTRPATDEDYALESQVTSGLTATVTTNVVEYDASGNPTAKIGLTITNTSDSDITIAEVGSFQNVRSAATAGGTSTARATLFDRTVLDSPITIPAGGAAVLTYRIGGVLPA